jgi:chromosomal replication initiator protein
LGCTITKEVAEEILKSIASSGPTGLTIEAIQREVASYFEVKILDLKGPKRHQAVAHPRLIAMYLSRQLTGMSYPEIGSRFGGKDHSTVISAVRKIERKVTEDPNLRSIVSTLTSRLRQR